MVFFEEKVNIFYTTLQFSFMKCFNSKSVFFFIYFLQQYDDGTVGKNVVQPGGVVSKK